MNTEQKHTLLPCPFCGGKAKEYERFNSNTVTCLVCGVKVRQSEMGQGDASERWNRQAALQSRDREDAERIQFMADEACTFNTWKQEDGSWKYRLEWDHGTEWQTEWFSTPEEAIDHARRVEENK